MGRIFKQLKVYSVSRRPEQTVRWSTSETEKEGTWYIRKALENLHDHEEVTSGFLHENEDEYILHAV